MESDEFIQNDADFIDFEKNLISDCQMLEISKLIDFDLVNLLNACFDLNKKYKLSEEYENEMLLKSFSLGLRTK